ncbi:putative carboxylesterase [Cladophialophora carrionii]|uniref:Carboxylic ester hydrolase n=1 Tax=Cladophialophora carrionii TaxID=86049 RepID=A0A1C1CII6_9EURO|nr:putative carboxylesterase [Cladophialophora carrionii]
MSTVTVEHPSIGSIRGLEGDGVYQFHGVQYATLKDRLAEAQVKTAYQSPVDATSHGPSAYSPDNGYDNEMLFIQQSMPKPKTVHSDLECLNLNITVPKGQTGTDLGKQKFPVFIWVHGGGFVVGANSWPHYDHGKLVKLANSNGIPVIGVGINYRLGFPGLLTSEELRQRGYKANNSLIDQRAAFRWVKQHIAGFGGDPENITVIGESAGAVATTLHLYSKEKLFNRAIATGGSSLLVPVFEPADQERTYQQVLSILGLEKMNAEDRIRKLLTLPTDQVIAKLPPSVALLPTLDGDIIPVRPTFASVADKSDQSMPGKQWAEGLMIGNGGFDASVLGFMLGHLKAGIKDKFPASIKASLASDPALADQILESYGFTGSAAADTHDDEEAAFLRFLEFVNDISFFGATTAYARGWPASPTGESNIYAFFFNEPNPWPGAYQGRATHVLDVVFLFQNHNHNLSPAQRAAAEQLGLDWMKFVAGQKPWEAYTPEKKSAKVYGPSNGDGAAATSKVVDADSLETGRGKAILEIGDKIGFDKLNEIVGRFRLGL